jgi:hypothetical protein
MRRLRAWREPYHFWEKLTDANTAPHCRSGVYTWAVMDNTFPLRSQKKTGTRHNPAREGKAVAANQRQIEPQVASLGMGVNLADKVPKKYVIY